MSVCWTEQEQQLQQLYVMAGSASADMQHQPMQLHHGAMPTGQRLMGNAMIMVMVVMVMMMVTMMRMVMTTMTTTMTTMIIAKGDRGLD